MQDQDLETRAINTIRFLAADAVQKANSGHPGLPMGTAAMAFVVWTRHLKEYSLTDTDQVFQFARKGLFYGRNPVPER